MDILASFPADVEMGELEKTPEEGEIRKIVFEICAESASGPDGYSALFFQACWEIIKKDMVDAVAEFFEGVPIPR